MNTIKRIAVIALIAVIGTGVAEAKFRFGIKAGINVENLHLNNTQKLFDKDNGVGWTAGVMTDFQLPLIGLGFDLSLMYQHLNSDIKVFADGGEPGYIKNSNFIQIPLNVKYKISLPLVGNFLAPYIFTGPAFSFRLDKNTVANLKTKTCQVAWNVGLGLELIKHLQVSASYGFGINNIASHWVSVPDIKVRNNYWTVTAAYLF